MVTAVLLAVLAAQAPSPELLERLAAHDARMEKYFDAHPVKVRAVINERDGDGALLHIAKSEVEQSRSNGQQRTKVLGATRDSKDDSDGEKDRAAKRDKENKRTESPFAARNQAKYTFAVVSAGERVRISFAPKGAPAAEVFVGQAEVDAQTGEPVWIDLKPSKNPMFVDRMNMRLEYDEHVEDAGRILSKFKLEGAGGLLVFHRSGEATMTFSYDAAK